MILLKTNESTTAIFTLSEKEETSSDYYILNMKNTLTGVEYSDIEIYDASEHTERYNKFLINVAQVYEEFTFSENTVLEEDTFYIVNCDIIIDAGVTLEIPDTTFIVQNSEYDILNNGIISDVAQLISIDIILDDEHYIINDSDTVTILLNISPGYYDYTIYNENKTEVLEIGRILIDREATSKTIYDGPETNVHVYKK